MENKQGFVIEDSILKRYTGLGGDVVVPEGVTEIGWNTFEGCTRLTSVTIPASVTKISGSFQFKGCTGLTHIHVDDGNQVYRSIDGLLLEREEDGLVLVRYPQGRTGAFTLPEGVTKIGSSAFWDCTGLTSVTIPEGVTEIDNCAFHHCTGLTSVTIPASVTTIDDYAFRECAGLTSITIPEGVTTIGKEAFVGCASLTSVAIPASVTKIGDHAFEGCTGLTSISIPEGVTEIGSGAFQGCAGLTSITIPASVAKIAEPYAPDDSRTSSVFFGCTALTHIHVDEGNQVYRSMDGLLLERDEDGLVLVRCPQGRTGALTVPEGVTKIGRDAFEECTGLISVTIPEGVTEIAWSAFEDCTRLARVTIPASVIDMGWPFQGCTALTDILVDAGNPVLRMTGGMLLGQDPSWDQPHIHVLGALPGIRGEVIVPEGVAEIASFAFHDCAGPFHITIPATIGSFSWRKFSAGRLADGAFRDCKGLTGITIPEGIGYIGLGAFAGCTGLTSISIPEGVSSIGKRTFAGCTSLTRVDLPASVKDIYMYGAKGQDAFLDCTSLTEINVDPKNQVFASRDGMLLRLTEGGAALYLCPRGRTGAVSIPEGVTQIDSYAFRNYTGMTSVSIPASVTSVGSFHDCKDLTHIYVAARNRTYLSMDGMLVKREEDGLVLERCPEGKTGALTIPRGITKIGDGAFSGCTRLTRVSIPQGVTEIGCMAFYACARMERIDIPEGVTMVGFKRLRSRFYRDGFTLEPIDTFARCYNLKDVFLPASVTKIGEGTFSDCGTGKYVHHTLTIHAPAGSYAEKYAKASGHRSQPTYL